MPSRKLSKSSKSTKKPTARGTRSTRTPSKKTPGPAKGVRRRRVEMTETLRKLAPTPTLPAPPASITPADLREAIRDEESAPTPTLTAPSTPEQEVQRIRESAQRLGIELDAQEALQWLTQMAVQDKSEITVDPKNSVYGARIAIMDFSSQDLAYFRRIGKIVGIPDQPGVVETALALSGSAAQSKIQTHPGDADFFQRVNIYAPTRAAAVQILADTMRGHALATRRGPDYQLLTVKFGTHDVAGRHGPRDVKPGSPMTWSPQDLEAGSFDLELADGAKKTIRWEDGMVEPGWTKIDWIVADPQRGMLANASNLLDVTWQGPDAKIVPLDGLIDPYFQEVYLDAGSVPVFSKLVKEVDNDAALPKYVKDLEYEVWKYLVQHTNYGKVAKRSYNIFRLTGRYAEAAYVRELFDEPATALYRVWSMFETLSGAATPDSQLDRVALLKQYDSLIEAVIRSTDGEKEVRIVRALMRARDESLGLQPIVESLDQQFATSRDDVMELLNSYFHDRLYGLATIAAYLEEIRQRSYG